MFPSENGFQHKKRCLQVESKMINKVSFEMEGKRPSEA